MILSLPINGCNAKCDHCDKLFRRKLSRLKKLDTQMCSQACRNAYQKSKNMHNCAQCGVEFYRVPGKTKNSKQLCCSHKCNGDYHRGENHALFIPNLEGRPCAVCSKEITNRYAKKFCSHECRLVFNRGSNHVKYNHENIPCAECNKEILRTKGHRSNGNRFCSNDCKNTFHSKMVRAENNPRFSHGKWIGHIRGKLVYAGFTKKLRDIIRDRDKNTCQVCGMEKDQHVQNMHVHHIDHDRTNNDPKNLICVCKHCHGNIHGSKKQEWKEILSEKSA